MGYGISKYVTTDIQILPIDQVQNYIPILPIVIIHGAFGVLALILGPWIFLLTKSHNLKWLHRYMGRLYMLCILISAPTGLIMSARAYGGWSAKIGFIILSLFWLWSAYLAYRAIRNKQFLQHRQWMIRNYICTFSAVMLRQYIGILEYAGFPYEIVYPICAWFSWLPHILILELFIFKTYKPYFTFFDRRTGIMKAVMFRKESALTFVEILITLLVIAVLAAIAVPNFLEFRGRSSVSRVKSEHRSLATAIEAYFVDNNEYPAMINGAEGINGIFRDEEKGAFQICTFRLRNATELSTLSTPIQYISSYFSDPHAETEGSYYGYRQFRTIWILTSFGPDEDENDTTPGDINNTVCEVDFGAPGTASEIVQSNDNNFEPAFDLSVAQPSEDFITAVGVLSGNAISYDPSNGTTSEGDIFRIKQ